tara:strand:+ start:4731 stop:5858 length:1128 start_codon:yes stop_codon:yes gene_type:complete
MKVFLSHSSLQKTLVSHISGKFEDPIISWLDEKEIILGDQLDGAIKSGIEGCDFFIVFLSRDAIKSEWVEREIKWARDKKHDILVVKLDDLKGTSLGDDIEGSHYLELQSQSGIHIDSLAKEISSDLFKNLARRYAEYSRLNFSALPDEILSRVEQYADSVKIVQNIPLEKIKNNFLRAFDNTAALKYQIVSPVEVYLHDLEIIQDLKEGDIYRATHPFTANAQAFNRTSAAPRSVTDTVAFSSYTEAQIEAAKKGVKIQRLYIVPSLDEGPMSQLGPEEIAHLEYISGTNIEARVIFESRIDITDLSLDYVIVGENLLGSAFPQSGQMHASNYSYFTTGHNDITRYIQHFDLNFRHARNMTIEKYVSEIKGVEG